jgi:hypothetical protein
MAMSANPYELSKLAMVDDDEPVTTVYTCSVKHAPPQRHINQHHDQ